METRSSDAQGPAPGALEEAARAAALWRLAVGAAHALNNALTAILGEASYLRDERKHDATVAEGCDAIIGEVDRCARLTRAILARRGPVSPGPGECDLVGATRKLGQLLPEVLGRRLDVALELPDQLLPVCGDAATVELLMLLLVQAVCDLQPGGGRLVLCVEQVPEGARLGIALEAQQIPPAAAAALRDPRAVDDPRRRLACEATLRIAARLGAALSSHQHGDRLVVELVWPLRCDG